MTVPRLELRAAALAVKIAVQLSEELDMEVHDEVFWTDRIQRRDLKPLLQTAFTRLKVTQMFYNGSLFQRRKTLLVTVPKYWK